MSVIKETAITEPLVDVVEGKAVVSNAVPILNLDLLTCNKEDCDFASSFTLNSLRNDFCHAFVAYFECAFTQVHKPFAFSTSPFTAYTHWKQTVFYLQDPLTICAGEEINGHISCKPNQVRQQARARSGVLMPTRHTPRGTLISPSQSTSRGAAVSSSTRRSTA